VVANGLRAGEPGLNSRQGLEVSLYSTASRSVLGSTSMLSNGYGCQSKRGLKLISNKCLGQKWWSYNSTPPYVSMAWRLRNLAKETLPSYYPSWWSWWREHGSFRFWRSRVQIFIYCSVYPNTQDVPGGKVNTVGCHSIGHSKQKSVRVYVHVTYSERFPRYFTVQFQNCW
jgi:hypothetical protein